MYAQNRAVRAWSNSGSSSFTVVSSVCSTCDCKSEFFHSLVQRQRQIRGRRDPIAERAATKNQAVPRGDVFLPVQRRVIAVLGQHRLREQARTGQAFLDRLRRLRRERHVLFAMPAGVLHAHVLDHLVRRGNVFELLARLAADLRPLLAAAGTRALFRREFIALLFARQVSRQFATTVAFALRGLFGCSEVSAAAAAQDSLRSRFALGNLGSQLRTQARRVPPDRRGAVDRDRVFRSGCRTSAAESFARRCSSCVIFCSCCCTVAVCCAMTA